MANIRKYSAKWSDDEIDLTEFKQYPISSVEMTEEHVRLAFGHLLAIELFDDGQCCCEHRYMRTDDDIQSLVGATLIAITVKDGPEINDGDVHEQQFLEIQTTKGLVTIANHNEHNGYYGGFSLVLKPINIKDMSNG